MVVRTGAPGATLRSTRGMWHSGQLLSCWDAAHSAPVLKVQTSASSSRATAWWQPVQAASVRSWGS